MIKLFSIASLLVIVSPPVSGDPGEALKQAVAKCWRVPAGTDEGVRILFSLDAAGALASPPVAISGDPTGIASKSAILAIKRCAPYPDAVSSNAEVPFSVEMDFEPSATSE